MAAATALGDRQADPAIRVVDCTMTGMHGKAVSVAIGLLYIGVGLVLLALAAHMFLELLS